MSATDRHDRRGRRRRAPARRARRGRTTSRRQPRPQLDNGLTVLVADLPGRPLVSASVILPDRRRRRAGGGRRRGRAGRPGADRGHRALRRDRAWPRPPSDSAPRSTPKPAGTRRASSVDVPATPPRAGPRAARRGAAAPDLPGRRGRAPARRAPQRPAAGPGRPAPAGRRGVHRHDLRGRSPYHRPSGGTRETVEGLDATRSCARPTSGPSTRPGPRSSSAGDLGGQDVARHGRASCSAAGRRARPADGRAGRPSTTRRPPAGRVVRVVHRPGASRPRSASATAACRGGSPTSTPSRS